MESHYALDAIRIASDIHYNKHQDDGDTVLDTAQKIADFVNSNS